MQLILAGVVIISNLQAVLEFCPSISQAQELMQPKIENCSLKSSRKTESSYPGNPKYHWIVRACVIQSSSSICMHTCHCPSCALANSRKPHDIPHTFNLALLRFLKEKQSAITFNMGSNIPFIHLPCGCVDTKHKGPKILYSPRERGTLPHFWDIKITRDHIYVSGRLLAEV